MTPDLSKEAAVRVARLRTHPPRAPDQVERFSHGEDGFWQDPDGLYVEHADYQDQEHRAAQAERLQRIAEKRLNQRDEELRERLEQMVHEAKAPAITLRAFDMVVKEYRR